MTRVDDSSDLKLRLLDELCDKLDESGIPGNVIERDHRGKPYVNIWYGSYENRCAMSEMFTVVITDYSLYCSPEGCYEIKPPNRYSEYFNNVFMDRKSRRAGFYIMSSDRIISIVKQLFNKEHGMNEFTLEKVLFGKLRLNCITYRFRNDIYNPEEIIITTRVNRELNDIASVRSIPNSESTVYAYEVRWFNVSSCILAKLNINRIKSYELSDALIHDILSIENELKSQSVPLDVYTYAKADVIATEAMYKYCNNSIVDVIFNDPATIIIWADGSKTVVKAENEKFDPEKGLAMAISKKILGNKHDYYEVFKKYVGRYEKQKSKMKGDKV